MKKILCALLCCTLALTVAAIASGESEAPLRTIQDSEHMLLEGKDLFAYTSGELYALLHSLGLYDPETIGYIGYDEENPEDLLPGLALDFDGFFVMAWSDDPDAHLNREALLALPLEQTSYRPLYVGILEPGIPGPFGVEVGMSVEALLALLPELAAEPGEETRSEYTLTMRYQCDAGSAPAVYRLLLYCADEQIVSCYISLE